MSDLGIYISSWRNTYLVHHNYKGFWNVTQLAASRCGASEKDYYTLFLKPSYALFATNIDNRERYELDQSQWANTNRRGESYERTKSLQ